MNDQTGKTYRPEDEMNAYKILLQRHLNDDRLMGERSAIFLTSSSILFLGFVMLLPLNARMLHIILPLFGIILSALAMYSLCRTSKGLDFWDKHKKEIEDTGQSFAYMREKKMTPQLVYKGGLTNRRIYTYCVPLLFIALWISSLVWVLRN